MGKNTCFIPGCKTGYNSDRKRCKLEGKKVHHLFGSPRNDELFEKWKAVIPTVPGKEFSKNNSICALHFNEDDIQEYFITKLPDGTEHRLERIKPILRNGAVPRKLSNPPFFYSESTAKTKLSSKEEIASNVDENSKKEVCVDDRSTSASSHFMFENLQNNTNIKPLKSLNKSKTGAIQCIITYSSADRETVESEIKPIPLSQMMSSVMEKNNHVDQEMIIPDNLFSTPENLQHHKICIEPSSAKFSFDILLGSVNLIKKPSKWWGVIYTEEYLIFARWTSDCMTDRRIVIQEDLNFKVFHKDKQIDELADMKISSVDDVSVLLENVDKLHLCSGVQVQKIYQKKCLLYLPEGKFNGLCVECNKIKKQLAKAEGKPICVQTSRYQKLRQHVLLTDRKNFRLNRKVTSLREQIAILKKDYAAAKAQEKIKDKKIQQLKKIAFDKVQII